MPFTKVQICNIALARIGVGQEIANIDTERSNEATQCRKFFEPMRDFALVDYDWNFSRRRVALALASGDPPTNWKYKYTYPSDCLAIRALVQPGLRFPRADQRIPYEVANEAVTGGDQVVIYTDQQNAEAIYAHRVTDPSLFSPGFASALAYLIGSEIAMPLAVNAVIAKQARDAYVLVSSRAAAQNLQERETGKEPAPEAIAYRNA